MKEENTNIKTGLWITAFFDVLLIIFAGVLIYLVFSVKVPEARSLASDISTAKSLEKSTSEILQITENTKDSRAKLASFFVSKESIVSFIEELESLAKQANVVLTMDTPLEEKEAPLSRQASLRLNVKVNGQFSDVMYFVRLIENLPYKIFVDRVVLTSLSISTMVPLPLSKTVSKTSWAGSISFRLDSYINK